MGSGISVTPTAASEEVHEKLQRLLANKKKMDKVFKTIAASGGKTGKIDKDYDISQIELLTYFAAKDPTKKDPLLRGFRIDNDVINAAYFHVAGKKSTGITKKKFRELLPTMFLYSELWKIFGSLDNNIDDKKIFKGEFLRAYEGIKNVAGVTFENVTVEEWESHFVLMDKDKSGFISFDEFCTYVVKHIITPIEFIDKKSSQDKDDDSVCSDIVEGENYELDENGDIVQVLTTAANTVEVPTAVVTDAVHTATQPVVDEPTTTPPQPVPVAVGTA
eukprot:gene1640-3180_t